MPDTPSPRLVALALRALADEIEDGRLVLVAWSDTEERTAWSGSRLPTGVRVVEVRVARSQPKSD